MTQVLRAFKQRTAFEEKFAEYFVETHRGFYYLSGEDALPLSQSEHGEFTARAGAVLDSAERMEKRLMRIGIAALVALPLVTTLVIDRIVPQATEHVTAIMAGAGLVFASAMTTPAVWRQMQMSQLHQRIARRLAGRDALPQKFIAERRRKNPYKTTVQWLGVAIVVPLAGLQLLGMFSASGQPIAGVSSADIDTIMPMVLPIGLPFIGVLYALFALSRWREHRNARRAEASRARIATANAYRAEPAMTDDADLLPEAWFERETNRFARRSE